MDLKKTLLDIIKLQMDFNNQVRGSSWWCCDWQDTEDPTSYDCNDARLVYRNIRIPDKVDAKQGDFYTASVCLNHILSSLIRSTALSLNLGDNVEITDSITNKVIDATYNVMCDWIPIYLDMTTDIVKDAECSKKGKLEDSLISYWADYASEPKVEKICLDTITLGSAESEILFEYLYYILRCGYTIEELFTCFTASKALTCVVSNSNNLSLDEIHYISDPEVLNARLDWTCDWWATHLSQVFV